jgi:hypothetical protein
MNESWTLLIQGRANVFMFGMCGGVIAEIISPSVASFLMVRSPWIPIFTGLGLITFAIIPALWIPETLHLRPDVPSDTASIRSFTPKKSYSYVATVRAKIADGLKSILESATILNSLPVILLLIPFVIVPFSGGSIGLSLRYISKRFEWKIADTAFLLSLLSAVNLLLLAVFLPGLSYFLTEQLHFSGKEKDLSLARASIVLLFAGALLIAASPTIGLTITGLVVITLGTGFASLIRSLITTLVDKEHVARLYSAIAIVEVISALVASPTLATLYEVGLRWKGAWIGLPFYGLAVICLCGGAGVWVFGFLKPVQEEMPFGDEERGTLVGDSENINLESGEPEADLIEV